MKTVALKSCDAAIHAKRHGGLREIYTAARCATPHLRAAFAENAILYMWIIDGHLLDAFAQSKDDKVGTILLASLEAPALRPALRVG